MDHKTDKPMEAGTFTIPEGVSAITLVGSGGGGSGGGGSSGDIVIRTGTGTAGDVLMADKDGTTGWVDLVPSTTDLRDLGSSTDKLFIDDAAPIIHAPHTNHIEIIDDEIHLNGMRLPMVEDFSYSIDKGEEDCTVKITLRATVKRTETEEVKKKRMSDEAGEFMKELKSL